MITRRLYRSVDSRLGTSGVLRRALAKVFPDRWSFMLGEIALYSFVSLLLTGVYLTMFFEPSTADTVYDGAYEPLRGARVSAAYASTVALSYDIRAGLLIRQAHHWAALVFVGAIVMHMLRIFFTGAYRRPREVNWLIGVTLLTLALLNGFTGYSMPDDLLSGTGLRIIHSVILSIPVVGAWLAFLLFGGEFPSEVTVPRLFVSHVLLVPAALVALISAHLAILVRQKHTHHAGRGNRDRNVVGSRFWPAYTLRSLGLLAGVLAVVFGLGGLVQINPVWIYGPFAPAQVTSPAQPDWYVAWGDGALRLFPPFEFTVFGHLVPAPFLPGVVVGGLTFTVLYAWPWIDRWRTGDRRAHHVLQRPSDRPGRLAFGAAVLTFFGVLLLAGGYDVIARFSGWSVTSVLSALRILVLALPPVVAAVAYLLARAVRAGRTAGVTDLTAADVRGGIAGETAEPPREPVGVIRLWRQPDQTWCWQWSAPDAEPLTSNERYLDRSEALRRARISYPDAPVEQTEPPVGWVWPVRHRPGPGSRVAAAVVVAALAVLRRRGRRGRGSGRR
ncbi:cytochrome bc1 complex cytochrome b subunit [Phytohabitans kaempferiae]|uniref:Cytochrome bc1 complex cytochrome b subunit n=1 Tax=Phytohabitans kaempferiae TaxID=1620943 RepID=A0ABV6MBB4_9ACTN